MNRQNGRPALKIRKWILVITVLPVLAAAVLSLLFSVNRFRLELRLTGEERIILEYGEAFTDPGVRAVFSGSWILREGFVPEAAEIRSEGAVDTAKTGEYTITYYADYYFWQDEVCRTVLVVDTVCPVITLTEDMPENLIPGQPYQEAGFIAVDNYDGIITDRVVRTESMGVITYAVADSSGNPAVAQREVPFHDPVPPVIRLEGGEDYTITTGTVYHEPGFLAEDNVDGDLTEQVLIEGTVDWLTPGIYPVTYTVTDTYENTTTVVRNVEVAAQPRPEILWPGEKTIYLTFDDGPGPYTEKLLDILDKYQVKATFFVMDSEYADLMKQITDRGHSIGIHSVTHNYDEIYASPEAYFADLYRMQELIYEKTGVKTTLMRFPGGSSNTVSIKICRGIMSVLTEAVQDAGFQYFDWNVDSDDAGGAQKSKTVRENVIDGVLGTGPALVLQHDIHSYSVKAVEKIITWGLENGYTFLPLSPDSPPFHHPLYN